MTLDITEGKLFLLFELRERQIANPEIVHVMCPAPLCGHESGTTWDSWRIAISRQHNVQRDWSHFKSAASSRHIGCRGILADPVGGSHCLRAASFIRMVISAYRFVVCRLTWPSHPPMTLRSTPASSRWTAVLCRQVCGETLRGRPSDPFLMTCWVWRRTIL